MESKQTCRTLDLALKRTMVEGNNIKWPSSQCNTFSREKSFRAHGELSKPLQTLNSEQGKKIKTGQGGKRAKVLTGTVKKLVLYARPSPW